ncbi:MAG TPA: DUF3592 domain-containing protein [Pseudonocardiaceae bacterium]
MKSLPPLWGHVDSGPAPQHNMVLAVVLLIGLLLLSYGVMKGIITKAIPLMMLVRSGQEASGTVIKRKPSRNPYRKTTIPVVEFTSLTGERVTFSDIFANKGHERPGESVVVHYNPANPHELATMLSRRGSWRTLGQFVLFEAVVAGLAVGVLLDVIGVYRVDWL